jgi:hypothetical protein
LLNLKIKDNGKNKNEKKVNVYGHDCHV